MGNKIPKEKRNPAMRANLISRLFFWWTIKLCNKCAKNGLTMEDLWPPMASDESEQLTNNLEKAWNEELKRYEEKRKCHSDNENLKLLKPSLTRAIIKAFWLRYFITTLMVMFELIIIRNLQPYFVSEITKYFDVNDEELMTRNEAFFYATGLIISSFGSAFIMHHTFLMNLQMGMRIRIACCSLIYRKSLKLSKASIDKTAVGQVINLLSNDVHRFDLLSPVFHALLTAPIQIIVIGYITWQCVGIYTLAGIGSLIAITISTQIYAAKISGKLRGLIAKLTDRRVQLTNELIAGIQVVKMYAWELPFSKIISETRIMEMKQINHATIVKGIYAGLFLLPSRLALFLTIVTFISAGGTLSPDMVFLIAGYYNIIQFITANYLPVAVVMTGEVIVSIQRIQDFLISQEIHKSHQDSSKFIRKMTYNQLKHHFDNSINTQSSSVHIEFNRVFANWIDGQLPPTLNDISLKIKGGDFCSIIGPVGSGKSSLLHLLLQELPIGTGVVRLFQNAEEQNTDSQSMRGFFQDNLNIKISYASQDPWLFTDTVRENILFGQEYDRTRYHEVTKVCCLLRDFNQFPNNDLTIVGERGLSLSGGQRARINLARAIYRQADIYLLDDPLSAVDARVAHQLFEDCIVKYLKGKTRILATHQIHYLKKADNIVVLDRGMIKTQGLFETLAETSSDFNDMLNHSKNYEKELDEYKHDESVQMGEINEEENVQVEDLSADNISAVNSMVSIDSQDNNIFISNDESSNAKVEAQIKNTSEKMEIGKLSNKVYYRYFRAGGSIFALICFAIIYTLAQAVLNGSDYWLSYWTNLESMKTCINDSLNDCKFTKSEYNSLVNSPLFTSLSMLDDSGYLQTNYAIYIYTISVIACILLLMFRSLFFVRICMNASKILHEKMFFSVLQTTMHFFTSNPSGRILNRFSKDVGTMDEIIPKAIFDAFQMVFVVVGICILIVIVNLWMIIPIVIISVIIYIFSQYYNPVIQDSKRLEGIARSPVFSHVTASINGITTIRSCGQDLEAIMRRKFDKLQDDHTGAWFLVLITTSAHKLIVHLLGCIFICCLSYSLLFVGPENTDASSVGFVIVQTLSLILMLQFGAKQFIEMQYQMTCIERLLQYIDLPKENVGNMYTTPENWPSKGRIQFKSVFLSYNKDDPAVLNNINLKIEPGWKVGVVGRTGAGKSSLITVLFRLVNDGLLGEIIIDDKDTKEINLHDLRLSISIIPQEPVLFSATLRYNLDPFGKYTDDVIWDALKEVKLSDLILDQWVTEGGKNFSVGQRQLICLARALLRNNKILVLDEATANIDSRTDALIQRTIRSKFIDCTVITIAHRLNTIIDSDRVLVMDAGRVIEFDSPYDLIFNNQDSLFRQMIEQTGFTMAEKLYKEAAYFYQKNIHA